jgi:hypothetical protein
VITDGADHVRADAGPLVPRVDVEVAELETTVVLVDGEPPDRAVAVDHARASALKGLDDRGAALVAPRAEQRDGRGLHVPDRRGRADGEDEVGVDLGVRARVRVDGHVVEPERPERQALGAELHAAPPGRP